MKKNVMMRIASILLVCVLATTCGISGTFAKYVTTGTGTDSARVAKWGVTISAAGDAFGAYYYNEANANGVHSVYEASTDSVAAQGGVNVVAPGTNGSMANIQLTGIPEVDFTVTFSANFSIGDKWTDGSNYYCPLIVYVQKLDGTKTPIRGTEYTNAAEFAAAVNAAIAACSFSGKAGTDLSTLDENACIVTWEWPFETGADDAEKAANNLKDTYLGNQANDGNAAQIYLEVTCTIEQVD